MITNVKVLAGNKILSVSWIWFFKIVFNYFMSVCILNFAYGEQVLYFRFLSSP